MALQSERVPLQFGRVQGVTPDIGILEWFHLGDRKRVRHCLDVLDGLGVRRLRTGISWADWMRPDGRKWIEWLIPTLAERVDLLPCFNYTPPGEAEHPATNAPPLSLTAFADFVCYQIELFGDAFEWVELWNEPDNHREWNAAFDPDYSKFAFMVGNAAKWARHFGKKTLLGGLANADPNFISLLHDHGELQHFDAVGVHGFPFSFEFYWEGWPTRVERLRERLDYCGSDAELWITETGYSTWRHDERAQLEHFVDAANAPAARLYWYCLQDLHPDRPTVDGFHSDEREYHFGVQTPAGGEKLLGKLWRKYGADAMSEWLDVTEAAATEMPAHLVIGGAGETGSALVRALLDNGQAVELYDDLSGDGSERALHRLRDEFGDRLAVTVASVLDSHALRQSIERASHVTHLAWRAGGNETARNYEENTLGTFHVVNECRRAGVPIVYGKRSEAQSPGLDRAGLLAAETLIKEAARDGHASAVAACDATDLLEAHEQLQSTTAEVAS